MSISTHTPSVPYAANPAVPTDPIWRLTVRQYHDMIQAGILTPDDPVELLQGWLVPKMPKNPPHRVATRLLRKALEGLVPAGWYVGSQEPITTQDSGPEPDAVIVHGDTQQYLDRHPGPQDVALVVEVADTTLQRDWTSKKQLYAAARIPVYWIVNLIDKQVEVYSEPSGQADYRQRRDYDLDKEVPLVIGGQEIGRLAVRSLMP
ncbi:MAG TPA: Uma2 family endonuclease [Gemmataceae bacterium]|nr:Uma2 family endonuclease [Gemmataceae bacterium]